MLHRLIKRLQQLTAKLNNFIKWGLSKSRLIGVVFAIARVESQIEQIKQEEKKMTVKQQSNIVQNKSVEIEKNGMVPFYLFEIKDWNDNGSYWAVTSPGIDSEFFTRLKSPHFYQVYSTPYGNGVGFDGCVVIEPKELVGEKGLWLKRYAKKSLLSSDRLEKNAVFFAVVDGKVIDLGE